MIAYNIKMDFSERADRFGLDQSQADAMVSFVVDALVEEYRNAWTDEIGQSLHSTRPEYERGIFAEKLDNNTAVIGLTPRQSKLAMMIEDGANVFDMKEGFKNSKKAKNAGTSDWYLTIPFRWATAEALAESSVFANRMPSEIQAIVKRNQGAPLMQSQIPQQFKKMGWNPTTGTLHVSNIYEGLQRKGAGSTVTEKRGNYFTFRRVSEKSQFGSWIHPGFEARRLMDKAFDKIDVGDIVSAASREFTDNM